MATLNNNGRDVTVDVPADMPLLWVLHDVVGLTGTKFGCGTAGDVLWGGTQAAGASRLLVS